LLRNITLLEVFGKSLGAISSSLIYNSRPSLLTTLPLFQCMKNKKQTQYNTTHTDPLPTKFSSARPRPTCLGNSCFSTSCRGGTDSGTLFWLRRLASMFALPPPRPLDTVEGGSATIMAEDPCCYTDNEF
jgi:hypothetical protein